MSSSRSIFLALLCVLSACFGCTDDETPQPALRFDMGEVRTDDHGRAIQFIPDGGRKFTITNPPAVTYRPDTVYRAILSYTSHGDKLTAYQFLPMPVHEARPLKTAPAHLDPVTLISAWRGGNYLNMRVGLAGSYGAGHRLEIGELGIDSTHGEARVLWLWLLHGAGNDRADFVSEVYLTVTLTPFADRMRTGRDSVELHYPTAEGARRIMLPY